jgi:hypothetical protein
MPTLDTQRFKLHLPSRVPVLDQAAIFNVPGLYEHLFCELLECSSPELVCRLLREHLNAARADPRPLTALDFGAGNGMVGEQLARTGFGTIVVPPSRSPKRSIS